MSLDDSTMAEDMEDGLFCQHCGQYIPEDEQTGTWITCADCKAEGRQ